MKVKCIEMSVKQYKKILIYLNKSPEDKEVLIPDEGWNNRKWWCDLAFVRTQSINFKAMRKNEVFLAGDWL